MLTNIMCNNSSITCSSFVPYLGTFCLTLPNMAVTVSNVVIPMETLPGTDSTEMKRESQARLTKTMEGKKVR